MVRGGAGRRSRARPSASGTCSARAAASTASCRPNNWQSIFGGPAWTRVGRRASGTCTCSTRGSRTSTGSTREVRAEFEDVLRFWLDRGVDGFRIDVAHGMVKEPGLPDWDGHVSMIEGSDDDEAPSPGAGNQGPMFDQDGVHEIYRAWHRVLSRVRRRPRARRRGVGGAAVPAGALRASRRDAAGLQLRVPRDAVARAGAARRHHRVVRGRRTRSARPTTWVLSNHDVVRHASRLGLSEPGSRPNGIGHGRRAARRGARPAPRARRDAAHARPARLGLPVPGRGARPARPHVAARRAAPGPGVLPHAAAPSAAATAAACRCRGPPTDPGFGFSPTGATWLPQPPSWAALRARRPARRARLDVRDVPHRAARAPRREARLRRPDVAALGADVLAFVNRDVLVVANLGDEPVTLPRAPGAARVRPAARAPTRARCSSARTPRSGCAPDVHPLRTTRRV